MNKHQFLFSAIVVIACAILSCTADEEEKPTKPYIELNYYNNPLVGISLRIPYNWTMNKVQDSIYAETTEWLEGNLVTGNYSANFGFLMSNTPISNFSEWLDGIFTLMQETGLWKDVALITKGELSVDGKPGGFLVVEASLNTLRFREKIVIFNHRGYCFQIIFLVDAVYYDGVQEDFDFILNSISLD
jgi:hypothetical protein